MTNCAPINTAMVLAAGQGTRMRPLTDIMPKPLVPLNGKPLIDHVLDRLAAARIQRVVVNVNHFADQLEAYVHGPGAAARRLRVDVSDEREQLLDTGGGVNKALPLLGPEPFLIHNSDSVWIEGFRPNLDRLMQGWDEQEMDFLLLVAPAINSVGYAGPGDFSMAADGRLSRRRERQVVPFAFTGVSIAHPRLFKDAPVGPFSLNLLWNRAIESKRLFGIRHDGIWMHVGTPESVKQAERCLQTGECG